MRDNDPNNPIKINKDAYNIHSGRLVEYSGTNSETEEAREQSPPAPSTPASPSPSRNRGGGTSRGRSS